MKSMLKLSEEKVKDLQRGIKEAENGREAYRMVVILLCGFFSIEWVMLLLGVSQSSVYQRLSRYRSKGMASFADAPRSGRPCLLNEAEHQRMRDQLENSPENWTCQRLAGHTGAKASIETTRRTLHSLGYVMKRPRQGAPVCTDPDKAEKLARIEAVKTSLTSNDILLYVDESDFNLLSDIRACWQKKGTQKRIQTPGKNKKMYVFGAIDSERKHFVYRLFQRKRSCEFVLFLRQILQRFPGKTIHLILDNFSIHKTQAVTHLLQQNERLNLLFLPTYSPDLNEPIESTWRIVKGWSTANQVFDTLDSLISAVKSGLQRFQQHIKLPQAAL